ncbi:RNA-directed DNA polymerase from mobile element jockey [Fusarium oxysporum f. sp. albedinis]|nr:RNA-directed DNA polymerase from mobile element jockey [Fusarium oxysporum f. sp. albedinis]
MVAFYLTIEPLYFWSGAALRRTKEMCILEPLQRHGMNYVPYSESYLAHRLTKAALTHGLYSEASHRMKRLRNVECPSRLFLDDFPVKRAGMNVFRPTSVFTRAERRPLFVVCCDKSLWAMLFRTASFVPVSRPSSNNKAITSLWVSIGPPGSSSVT